MQGEAVFDSESRHRKGENTAEKVTQASAVAAFF